VSRSAQLAALGTVMCLLAAAFAVPALYVPGVTLVLLALAAAVSVSAASHRARVELDVSAERLEEGEHLTVDASVTGGVPGSCRGVLRVLPGAPPEPLRWGERSATRRVRPVSRGRLTLGPASARWADPFQLCVRERVSATRELVVLPRVHALERRDIDRILALPDSQPTPAPGLEFDGLRPHQPGSPASRIHWLSVARTGIAMERRLCEEAGRTLVTIVLDARAADSGEALDRAVRATASLCSGMAGAGGCSLLLPGRPRLEMVGPALEGWPRLHELLALVAAGEAPRWELVRNIRRLVLVQAHRPQPPPGVSAGCVVSPSPDRRAAVLFTVAGCSVQALADTRAERAA
jgi:uncharacterized protein (DUF58 family)